MSLFWIVYWLTLGFFIAIIMDGLLSPIAKDLAKKIITNPISLIFLIPLVNTIFLIYIACVYVKRCSEEN